MKPTLLACHYLFQSATFFHHHQQAPRTHFTEFHHRLKDDSWGSSNHFEKRLQWVNGGFICTMMLALHAHLQ